MIEVIQFNSGGTCSQALAEPNSGSLMAEKRTVVDVVGSINSGKQLQKETRFIGRTPTGIKERPVG